MITAHSLLAHQCTAIFELKPLPLLNEERNKKKQLSERETRQPSAADLAKKKQYKLYGAVALTLTPRAHFILCFYY